MNYTQFKNEVSKEIQSRLGNSYTITIQPVNKNNGVCYDGMIIRNNNFNISPTFYLNPYYHRYLDGVKMEDIYDDILKSYSRHMPTQNYNIEEFIDFNKAKSQIIYKLVNYEKNINILDSVPHIKYHDMVILFQYALADFDDNSATILINNEHVSLWKTDTDELYKLAMANTPKIRGINFMHMNDIVNQILDFNPFAYETYNCPMYVLSNKISSFGASVLLYSGLLKEIADKLHSNLIILPSSVHEIILIAVKDCDDYSDILSHYANMVKDVNESHVADDCILSDNAYIFMRNTEQIIMS